MAYKIAIGSSDEKNVDLKFGEVKEFLIYEVEQKEIRLVEKRKIQEENTDADCSTSGAGCDSGGCSGKGTGCGGPTHIIGKVEALSDCRCVVCKKVGFQAQKQFEKKAISVFDVECEVQEALEKITSYYGKIDNHQSYAGRK